MEARNAASVLADSVNNASLGSPSASLAAGGSSSTTKAFVPPRPSELTAANRGRSPCDRSQHDVLTKNGLAAKSILGLGLRKLRLGGIFSFFNARAVLISAASPAVCSRCPIFVLTEPIAHNRALSVPG